MSNKSEPYFVSATFMNLSLADVVALTNFFKTFEKNGTSNHSSYLGYFADGNKNFKPKVMFHSNLSQEIINKYTPLSWTFSSDPSFISPEKTPKSKPQESKPENDQSPIIPLTIFASNLINKQMDVERENWRVKNTVDQLGKQLKEKSQESKKPKETPPPLPQDPGQNVHEQFKPNELDLNKNPIIFDSNDES